MFEELLVVQQPIPVELGYISKYDKQVYVSAHYKHPTFGYPLYKKVSK
jgi:hypothetical protein